MALLVNLARGCCNPCETCGGLFDNPVGKQIYAVIYDHTPFAVQHRIMSGVSGGVGMLYQPAFSSAGVQVFSGAGTPTSSPNPPRRATLTLTAGAAPTFSFVHKDDPSVFATAPALDVGLLGGISTYKGAAYQCGPDGWEMTTYANPTIDARDYRYMRCEGCALFQGATPQIGTPESWCCPSGEGLTSCLIDYLPSSLELTISGFTGSGGWRWGAFNRTITLSQTLDFSDANAIRKGYATADITEAGCTWRHTATVVSPKTGGIVTSQCGATVSTSIVSGGASCTGSGGPFFQSTGPGWFWCQLGCRWGWAGALWGSSTPANPPFPVGDVSLTW